MPRTASFTSGVLQELFRELEYAPDETHLRQMDAAERLLEDLQPQRLYPEDFIVYRITSYRSDRPGTTTAVVGDALLRDLVNFIQRLSWDLDLSPQQQRGRAIPMDEVAVRLGVSRRTLQRCRRDGLVMHWIREESGRRRLSCFPDALERFLSEHGSRIAKASAMRRIDDAERQRFLAEARDEVASSPGVSLNEVALRLAVRSGRGHETVRRLLRRSDSSSSTPIFSEHGQLSVRDVELATRARRRGVSMDRIAVHFGKSEDALHRAIRRSRRRRLAGMNLPPSGGDPPQAELLDLPENCTDLPHPAFLVDSRPREYEVEGIRRDLAAHRILLQQVADGLVLMEQVPTVEGLDRVETDLRWATMLQLRAVLQCWPAALGLIEKRLQQQVTALPIDQHLPLLELAFATISSELEHHGPGGAETLQASIETSLMKQLDRQSVVPRPGRASARSEVSADILEMIARSNLLWPHLVPTIARLRILRVLPDSDSDLVRRRYGLDGCRPLTLLELAEIESTSPTVIARRLDRFRW